MQADSLELSTYLKLVAEKQIDCVILSPGPGRADNEKVRYCLAYRSPNIHRG